MATTLNAATFMGKNFSTIQSVVKNHESLTLKQMFDVTAQLVNNQEEMNCLDKILYGKNSWTHLSLIHDEVVINLQSTKVYVFSDSVLCLGKVLQHPECNEAWKNRVAGVRAERSYTDYDPINGESTEFEWNIFPGFTTLQLCDKISDLLSSMGQTPENFTGRILFMSTFNDIFCDRYDNKDECLRNLLTMPTQRSTESGEKSWKQRFRSLQSTLPDVRNVRSGRQHGMIRANHDKFGSKIEDVEDRLNEFLELVRRYDEANGTDPVPDQVEKACIISNTPEPLKTHLQLNVGKL